VTSSSSGRVWIPCARANSVARVSTRSIRLAARIKWAPRAAKLNAQDFPIPEEAPVMNTIRSFSLKEFSIDISDLVSDRRGASKEFFLLKIILGKLYTGFWFAKRRFMTAFSF